LSFILDDGDAVKRCCEKFIDAEKSSFFLFFGDTMQALIVGLSSLRIYRETRCSLWLEMARKCKSDMKLWSDEGSQWNFKHKLLLLQAEEYYSIGDYVSAQDFYNKAIQIAKSHKAINDEALSCELAAKFFLESNEQGKALRHLRLALERYLNWG
jgi:tetratricopeptide (TPR) repeat protein